MAKKEDTVEKKVSSEDTKIEGAQESKPQSTKNDAGTVPSAPEAKVMTDVKRVKIHTTEEVNCIIAGVPYVFAKNKDAQVPTDVAAILVNAQKAYRQ